MSVERQDDEEQQCLNPLVASHPESIIPLETQTSEDVPQNMTRLFGANETVRKSFRFLIVGLLAWTAVRFPRIPAFALCLGFCFCLGLRIFAENSNAAPPGPYGRNCRVKSVAFHDEQPWIVMARYDGKVYLWKFEEEDSPQTEFVASELPVRVVKFIERKEWLVTVSDDMHLRVFSYQGEKLEEIEAHDDFIRSVEVHPTLPYIITSSDDRMIKVWDMEYNFTCICDVEAHSHYVMQVKLNPKDTTTFASASLDRTIKVWKIQDVEVVGEPQVKNEVTLEGHERGVNAVDYHPGDEPYLVSGSEDRSVKLWNYESRTIVCSIPGHTHNVSAVLFHPTLPIVMSASEDGTCILWSSQTHGLVQQLDHDRGRAWSLAVSKRQNKFAISYDNGVVCMNLQETEDDKVAVASEDRTWSSNSEESNHGTS